MSRFLDPKFQALRAYVPGEQPQGERLIKLNTNESPYPPAPSVTDRLSSGEIDRLKLYSDPDCRILREKLAKLYDVGVENVLVTNGSDEALNFAFLAYGGHGALFPDITYGFYRVFSQLYGIQSVEIPLRDDFSIDPDAYCGADGTLIVLANPNAPTGLVLPLTAIEQIAQNNPSSVVLIDEAYIDFGGESAIPLTKKYENLLVVQTFSKSRSMAGARLGYAIGNADLIADLNRLRCSTNPYNVNRLTLAAGEATIDAQPYYDKNCQRIIETREKTAAALRKIGCTLTASCANFLFVKVPGISGATVQAELRRRGILVRHFDAPRISDYNRITIGSAEEMEALCAAMQEIVQNEKEETCP